MSVIDFRPSRSEKIAEIIMQDELAALNRLRRINDAGLDNLVHDYPEKVSIGWIIDIRDRNNSAELFDDVIEITKEITATMRFLRESI